MMGERVGSTATVRILFDRVFLMYRETPVSVPPVPTPETNTSILPSVSSQISGPVVLSWIAGLAGFSNFPISQSLAGAAAATAPAVAIAALHPSAARVHSQVAPSR